MGLCKCPKKKVTNLFCYEHRVNVCEDCLVENHNRCIVQSYLAWLQDSDYDPRCKLCECSLSTPQLTVETHTDSPTVRLLCLHVFHQQCLSSHYKLLPANTAPAGFRCPVCQDALFPKPNHMSPTATELRSFLKTANWARAGLGLPLLPEYENEENRNNNRAISSVSVPVHGQNNVKDSFQNTPAVQMNHFQDSPTVITMSHNQQTGDAVGNMEAGVDAFISPTARKAVLTGTSNDINSSLLNEKAASDGDVGENKYKRRSALVWFGRWLRSRNLVSKHRDPLSPYTRLFFLLLLMIIALVTLITFITRVARPSGEGDSLWNPLANPNIRVAADNT